jgi:hypothetical protein
MVSQLPTEERWEAVEVLDIQSEYQGEVISDHNGNPQYRTSCKFSWSQYPVYVYVYRENCPTPFNVGAYNALVKRGSLLPKHNNTPDPTEYMFKHFITQWESIGQAPPAPQAPAPQAPYEDGNITVGAERELTPMETGALIVAKSRPDIFAGIDQNQIRIMRQATLKCASWMMVPLVADAVSQDDGYLTKEFVAIAEEMSEMLLEYVVTGEPINQMHEAAKDLFNKDPFE